MSNLQKIKALRDRLPIITLAQAKKMIDRYDDVDKSVERFHRNNINTICRLAECDEIKAEKYYQLFNYDIEKAIKKVFSELHYLTTDPDINIGLSKVGFYLWAENETLDKYLSVRDRSLFIPTEDFEYVIDIFRSFFPLKYPDSDEVQNNFDICFDNNFDNATCRQIVAKLARIETDDVNVEQFLRDLIKWLQERLRYADVIVVYGNQ